MRWLNAAAEAGEPRAMLLVGTALFNGDGVPQDAVKAYAYVSRAAAQGLAPAKATLADMDEIMPLEQRQKGVAMAKAMAGTNKPAAPAPVKVATAKPPVKPAAKQGAAPPVPNAAKPVLVVSGKWRIQLGAFGQRKSAESLFAKLAPKLGGRQAYYIPVEAVVRLQAGPFESRAAASAACARLAPQPCFAVEAR
jgi:TPR repeat protein